MSVLTAEAIFNPFVELETVDLYSRDLDTADVYYLGDMNPYDSGSSLFLFNRITTFPVPTQNNHPQHDYFAARVTKPNKVSSNDIDK